MLRLIGLVVSIGLASSDQLYFAADPTESTLPAVVAAIGEDRLVIGSDYCHPEACARSR